MRTYINTARFMRQYWPLLAGFMTSRLLTQTDLIMLTHVGPDAVAALGVPSRLMIIDTIAAFCLAPVFSVAISREELPDAKWRAVRMSLGAAAMASIGLVAVCMPAYNRLLDRVVTDPHLRPLASVAVNWMTATIPLRLLAFVGSMALFAMGLGPRIWRIYGVTLAANALLDILLIFKFQMGLSGAYLSTALVSAIELGWILWTLGEAGGRWPFQWPTPSWLRTLSLSLRAEAIRLASWQLEGLLLLSFIASRPEWAPRLTAFTVTSEALAVLSMPLIALMRTAAMQIAETLPTGNPGLGWRALASVRYAALALCMVAGIGLFVCRAWLGGTLYTTTGESLRWWLGFASIYAWMLPVLGIAMIARACWQAYEEFRLVAAVEICIGWLVALPLALSALALGSAIGFFASLACREALIAAALLLAMGWHPPNWFNALTRRLHSFSRRPATPPME